MRGADIPCTSKVGIHVPVDGVRSIGCENISFVPVAFEISDDSFDGKLM